MKRYATLSPVLTRLIAPALFFLLPALAVAQAPITVAVDLTDAPRKLFHAELQIPVHPGPLTLTAAKWIPGTHRPEGPIDNLTGLAFRARGEALPWRRDDVDMYAFHVTVPAGVSTLDVHVDCIISGGGVSDTVAMLEWEHALVYPAGVPVAQIPIVASVMVPAGWGIGSALTVTGTHGQTTSYAQTTLEMLEDSPVLTGKYFREIPLAPDVTPKHYLDVAGDAPEDIDLKPAMLQALNALVHEAGAMYGSHHYNSYHFLLTLSDFAGGQGLEHHQSSDNGVEAKGYSDDKLALLNGDLLPHEFTHSWNGKYRRPAGLATPDFATPMKGELLWVYEGMTQYLGNILAARSGFETVAQYHESLAHAAATLDVKPGRTWRNTEDTAIASSILRDDPVAWSNWRRGQDYYYEGELLWLDVDTTIRRLTDGKKSLHDFCVIFLGKGGDTPPEVVPYTFDELAADLQSVVPNDWASFLHQRVTTLAPHADLAGIEHGGYRLVYKDAPTSFEDALLGNQTRVDAYFSAGMTLKTDGTIVDIRVGSAADKARLAPGEKIVGVNGRTFTADIIKAAIRDAKTNDGKKVAPPIRLIVQNDTFLHDIDLDYHEGEKHPALERVDGTPDLLDEIIKPMIATQAAAPPAATRK